MSDREALLAAIKAHPEADTPRLMFADEIEETDPARAEFIRLQVARKDCVRAHDFDSYTTPYSQREWDLLCGRGGDNWREWGGVLTEVWAHARGGVDDWWNHFRFTRGFVCDVRFSAADWLAHADAILAEHPVRRVRLTTWPDVKSVVYGGGVQGWRFAGREHIHPAADSLTMLEAEWPGIEFELPPPAALPPVEVISTPFDFNAYLENAIAVCAQALGVPAHLLAGGTSGYSGAALALSTWQQMHALNNFTQDAFEQAAPLPPAE